jgi:SAM-dependent methyltransferase
MLGTRGPQLMLDWAALMVGSSRNVQWPQTPEEVERLNDQLATEHPIDAYYASSPWLIRWIQERRLQVIRQMVQARPGLRILEIGSGGGHVLRMFPQAKLTAVDVSQLYLDTAKKNLAGYEVEFVKGQIETLDFPSESYDRIICTEVLEHTVDPGQILRAIARLLTPEGHAVITVPVDPLIDRMRQILWWTPIGWLMRDRIQWGADRYHLHKWWPWQFQQLLAPLFRIEERRLIPPWPVPMHACFSCRPMGPR